MGCSEYENSMVLLPSTGYTFAERRRTINIDELDNVDIIETCDECVCFWNGESHGTKHDIELCEKMEKPCKICYFKQNKK